MIECVRCGAQLPAGTQICTRCGAQQPSVGGFGPQSPTPSYDQPTLIAGSPGATPPPSGQGWPQGQQGGQPQGFGQPPGFGQQPPPFGQVPPIVPPYTAAPPRRSRLPLIIGGVAGFLLLCCVGVVAVVALASRGSSGSMKFGSDYKSSGSSFEIVNERSSFTSTDTLALVGRLKERANATTLTLKWYYLPSGGSERLVDTTTITITNRDANQIAYKNPVLLLTLKDKGDYKFQIVRGSTVLSEGKITYR